MLELQLHKHHFHDDGILFCSALIILQPSLIFGLNSIGQQQPAQINQWVCTACLLERSKRMLLPVSRDPPPTQERAR
jgi:hypothetical protein